MADFDAPSFSLGLDFDLIDSEPQITNSTENNKHQSDSNRFSEAEKRIKNDVDDDDFETLTVVDSDSECQVTLPKLKRLRRGATVDDMVSSGSADLRSAAVVVDDDDIEDFSSPEDNRADGHLSMQHYSVCNSSKVPLSRHKVLTKESGKRRQTLSNGPESVLTSCNKQPFPKLTVSPLRKFQLVDSDSDYDEPSIFEAATNKTSNVGSESYLNRGKANLVGVGGKQKVNETINKSTRKDLWDDFPLEKSFHIATPAFDAVCEEYFGSKKEKKKSQSNTIKSNVNSHLTENVIDLDDPRPPAHQYFFHNDLRVQNLVRTRLPNFFPLNAENGDSEQPGTSNIDYMGQFSHGDNVRQSSSRTAKAKTGCRKNSRKPVTQEISQGFNNRKVDTEKRIPKVAGKRRVQADGQGAAGGTGKGHWFTSDGRRVYVCKNGKEHTGKAAYVLYKKESAGGFKNKNAKKK